jgi:hypothetical protein
VEGHTLPLLPNQIDDFYVIHNDISLTSREDGSNVMRQDAGISLAVCGLIALL